VKGEFRPPRVPDTSDCVSMEKAVLYESCRVAGVVRRVWIDPLQRTIEATIVDDTGSATARWAMKSQPRLEILPGAGLVLDGVLRMDHDGGRFMTEPAFEVVRDLESLPRFAVEGRPPTEPTLRGNA
jgi:hypothetical protein